MKDKDKKGESPKAHEPTKKHSPPHAPGNNDSGTVAVAGASASAAPEELGTPVELYVYDLSFGMARNMSVLILGEHLEGIWHTGIVIFGREYFFGHQGVLQCEPGGTRLGQPNQILQLGSTHVTKSIFLQHLTELRASTFKGLSYDLFTHNCNTFSNEVSNFLLGTSIPEYILNLPRTVLNTPLGPILLQFAQNPLIDSDRLRGGGSYNPPVGAVGAAAAAGLEESIRNRVLAAGGLKMSDEDSPSSTPAPSGRPRRDVIAEVEEEERREREEKMKNREPPIVFRDFGNSVEELLDELEKSLSNVELNDDEMRCMTELRDYALGSEGSWILSDEFLNLIGRILLDGDSGIGDDSRVNCLKVLAWLAVTKDDVILVLHQDRRDHVIMRFASHIDQLSPPCQEAVSLLICNLFENLSTSEWLLYISEWESDSGRGPTSNIRVSTKVGVHALLSKECKDIGSALVYNFVMKEVKTAVFDDVAVEMSLALLQFLSEKPSEPLIWRGLKSLLRCCQLARTEVPALVKMVGPPPNELKGTSARCDEIIESIDVILASVAG